MNQSLNRTLSLPFTRIGYNGQLGGCGKSLRDWHSEEPQAVLSIAKEESRMFMKMGRARFFAQFILSGQSEILRCAQDDSEGLRMTAGHMRIVTSPPKIESLL